MKIEKLKSGSYRIRKMYKGVTYTVVTDYKPTQKEALRLLSEEMDKIQSKKTHISFGAAANEYIDIRNVISSQPQNEDIKALLITYRQSLKKC